MAYTKKNWKDFPDTSTPITTEGLQNIEDGIENVDNRLSDEEIYTTATAGNNGDFHVTLTNTTLTNGRVVKISFPTATNGTSNARLSIDGGVTYINVRMGSVNVIAEELQNRRLEMVYDGTYFGFVGSIRGSNANGEWIKYADGTMICRRNIIATLNCSSVWGSLYYGTHDVIYDFPQIFIEEPDVQLTLLMTSSTSGWLGNYLMPVVTNTSFADFAIFRATSAEKVSVKLNLLAIGKWK